MTIQEFLENNGYSVKTKGKNVGRGWIAISCVFCSDRSTHLGFRVLDGRYHCFKCGASGSLKKFLRYLGYQNVDIEATFPDITSLEKKNITKSNSEIKWLNEFIPYLLPDHREYLRKRRFDPDYVQQKYGLMSSDHLGRFKFRCIIPIKMNDSIVSFVGRDITGLSTRKYLICPDSDSIVPRKSLLFNIDSVRDVAVIVEGTFDAMRIGDGAVATLSTQFSMSQVYEIIRKKPKRVFIMFDAEDEAQRRAKVLAEHLSLFISHVEVVELDSGDPADMTEDDVLSFRRMVFT